MLQYLYDNTAKFVVYMGGFCKLICVVLFRCFSCYILHVI